MATKARGGRGKRRKSSKASGGGLLPLLGVLAVVVGGISAYDHRKQLTELAGTWLDAGHKSEARHAEGSTRSDSRSNGPVPPAPIPARPPRLTAEPLPPAATPVPVVATLPRQRDAAPLPPATGSDVDQQVASLRAGMGEKQRFTGKFYYCGTSGLDNCVVDGDTFWVNRVKIRIADIDTPETEQAKCKSERDRGFAAKMRLRELLNQGSFELGSFGTRDEDDYGRKLRVVTRNGRSLGAMLVDEGLARPWTGHRKPWC
ncbi:thermonuclease family protein [Rhizobium paknamense]|uniref:Endonuclease YncB(Thermonuclease family) n=1 Tax=Rhizobium paknamense TaxID=1206817 RepID=A0ABU0I926_9HYPH|nr:thermonuclease family protein [Rhizobium paknamense]MDQ0454735.1 endonuclease YncB(thermonuclease family) [Rhizobium paknamense]